MDIEYVLTFVRESAQRFWFELILIFLALCITGISVGTYVINSQKSETQESSISQQTQPIQKTLIIHIAGSVKKPGTYELSLGSRLTDAVQKSGGLTEDADTAFFARNYNLARYIQDQEHIYIPSRDDIFSGIITEPKRIVDLTSPAVIVSNELELVPQIENEVDETAPISINTASIEELDQLPGVGRVTAGKIINGRPYQTMEELTQRKIVGASIYEKIKNMITTE